jgi:hypothetical protein
MNRFFVGAFWSAREESREECAARVATYLRGLASLPSELSTFYKGQWTRKVPLKQIPGSADEILPFLGQTYTNFGPKQLMPELGYRLVAWNGIPDGSRVAKLHVLCGSYSPNVGNSAILEFNSVAGANLDLLRHLVQVVVSAFDPDRALATWKADDPIPHEVECFTFERSKGLQSKRS